MGRTLENIQEHGVVTVVEAPVRGQLLHWARAVSEVGVEMLAIPVAMHDVAEVVDDLTDESDLVVGLTNVMTPEQISVAFAAGASFVISPITDKRIIEAGTERGIDVITGAATASEIAAARDAGAAMITIHPVGVMGGVEQFSLLARQFRGLPLLASGGIGPENAPSFLEAGALGIIVDQGVFPQPSEPAAAEIITARAAALMEVCAQAMGTHSRISISDALAPSRGPASGLADSDAPLDALIASEGHDPFADGAVPLDMGLEADTVEAPVEATAAASAPATPPMAPMVAASPPRPPPPPPAAAAAPPPPPPPPPPAPESPDTPEAEGDFEAFGDALDD